MTVPVFEPRPRRLKGKTRILMLATIPVIDPVVNQVNTVLRPSIGSFGMLQALRMSLLIVFLIMIVTQPARMARGTAQKISVAVGLCLACITSHEIWATDSLSQASVIFYGQIAYWLAVWYGCSTWIREPVAARIVIKGLAIGAVMTAVSVCYGYASGTMNSVYQTEGVTASSGWFVSGKGIAGSLVAGAVLWAYLGLQRRTWVFTGIAVLCLGASVVTYARAGMIALVVSLMWLAVWSARTRSSSLWARRLVIATFCGAVVFAMTLGTDDLVRRWSDVGKGQSAAGSGRLVLWSVALQNFREGTLGEQLFGRGVEGQIGAMYADMGEVASAHNDVMDMLVIGGSAGIGILCLMLAGILIQIRSVPWPSPEAASAVAILIILCCQLFFTGQLALPDVMAVYLSAIPAVLGCARRQPSVGWAPCAVVGQWDAEKAWTCAAITRRSQTGGTAANRV